jgi:hypothetical protein
VGKRGLGGRVGGVGGRSPILDWIVYLCLLFVVCGLWFVVVVVVAVVIVVRLWCGGCDAVVAMRCNEM